MNDSKYGTQCDTQTFTQEYSEVSLHEVSRDLRLRRFKIMDISKRDWKLFRERLSGRFIRKWIKCMRRMH